MILKGWNGYSLSLTLYPSFTLSLLVADGRSYVKHLGVCIGLKLSSCTDGVHAINHCDIEYIRELCGLAEDPLDMVNEVEPRHADTYYYLVGQWRGLGLSTASRDPDYVFVSVYLSRRTLYHRNVLYWVRELFKMSKSISELAWLDTSRLFRQPQLRELASALRYYLARVRPAVVKSDVGEVKTNLMSIKGVGPKVAYAFMLHAMRVTDLAPADTHYSYFLTKVMGLSLEQPKKTLCLRYDCYECNLNCMVGYSATYFGKALGYLQTVAYTHVKRLCKRGLCANCTLRRYKLCRVS